MGLRKGSIETMSSKNVNPHCESTKHVARKEPNDVDYEDKLSCGHNTPLF